MTKSRCEGRSSYQRSELLSVKYDAYDKIQAYAVKNTHEVA
jgi:hypothetical protein